jgi:glycosyltransferase involved in cell wall biosynthesis
MKKKVLFVMNNLNCGGAEKSLVSLLETLDFESYDVDLFLFQKEGLFLNKLPNQVKILDSPINFPLFNMSIKSALALSLIKLRIDLAFARLYSGFIFRTEKNRSRCDQRVWKYSSKSIKKMTKKYDIAIGYLEMSPIYFIVDKVTATKKIGWVHTNYSNSGMDDKIDYPYFRKLDYIVTVSEECQKSLLDHFPNLKQKIRVINNIVSPKIIHRLSHQDTEVSFDPNYVNLLTVARLCHVKGIDLVIESCKLLVEKGYKIRWYLMGTGTEIENKMYEELVKKNHLEEEVKFLGVKDNPYPYMKKADIYIQPSRFEGKSIAIEEAKILKKPIVVTNFSTAKDQITNYRNGIMTDMNSLSLTQGIKELIEDKQLISQLTKALSIEKLGSENEIYKLYEICG